ncbi:alpha/beta hydrolase fold domain-containing protein [Mycolicibacterium sp. XJ1819]
MDDPTSLTSPATESRLQRKGQPHSDTNVATHLTPNSTIGWSAAASESTAVPKDDDAELTAPPTQTPNDATSPLPATISDVPLARVSAPEPAVSKTDSPQPAAANDPAEPVELIVGAVSNLLGPLVTGGTPETPPAAPAAWSLLAFARREFDTALTPASVADDSAAPQTTSQTVQTQVENSLTYTPPPTIIDQLTLAALRLVRDITGFIGIPYTAIFAGLIASENPPFFLTLGLNARKTEFEVSPGTTWKVWEFEPTEPTGATVIAIHGGAAIYQPNLLHWVDYTQMARQTGATVLVPLYPLATTEAGSLLNVTPGVTDYISHVIVDRGAENVSVYADSQGYTYAFAAARQLILRAEELPARMVVVSGQADYSQENDGAGIDDPFFNAVTIKYFSTGVHTFDGIVDKDPRVSPLRMETEVLRALPPTTIYVGTEEITLPSNLLLYERAVEIGAPISMVVGRGQYHDWPLGGLPVNSAAPLVRRDIYRQLGLLSDTAQV